MNVITSAKALSFREMKALMCNRPELLRNNSFVSVTPDSLRLEDPSLVWPADSDRWMSTYFEDVRPEHMAILPRLAEELGRPIVCFDEKIADKIIQFLELCHSRPEPETLYANCIAGVSRSGAIVSFACEAFELDRKAFRNSNQSITPNGMVLYLLRERWQIRQAQKTGSKV